MQISNGRRLVTSPSRPGSRARNDTCTHTHMTRLYDEFGSETCSYCHRRPMLGWLYRCTQDHDNFLPFSDFFDITSSKRSEQDAHLYTLNPSISKAAAEGHYTDHQLAFLWKQKIEVRRLIQQVRPTTSSSASTASSSNCSLPASTTNSTIRSTASDTDPDDSFLQEYCLPSRAPLEPIQEVHDDLETDRVRLRPIPFARTVIPPACELKVCQNCRPIYRDRAWESMDRIIKEPYKPPPTHEISNRRISDANIVRNIGLYPSDAYWYSSENKRNSRTSFANTVQSLLRNQERSSDDSRYGDIQHHSYELKRIAASDNLSDTNHSKVSFESASTQDETAFARPLYHRRGVQRLTAIEPPPRSAISHCADDSTSPGPSTSQSAVTSPAVLEQGSDVHDSSDSMPPTPTEMSSATSVKKGLALFSKTNKSRFMID